MLKRKKVKHAKRRTRSAKVRLSRAATLKHVTYPITTRTRVRPTSEDP